MKKFTLLCATAIAACTLVTVKGGSGITATGNVVVASARHHVTFSNETYAVMSFLQFSKQQVNDIQDGSIQLNHDGDDYVLNDGNNEFNITISSKKVTIKSTDQNGKEVKHTYTKSQLRKKFNGNEESLKAKIAGQSNNETTANSNQQGTSQQDQPTDDGGQAGNKGMISENEWYQRLIAAGWDENSKTAEFYNHKAGLDGVQVAPQ